MIKKLLLLITLPLGLSAMDSGQWDTQLKEIGRAISTDSAKEQQVQKFLSQQDPTKAPALVDMANRLQRTILEKADRAKGGLESPEIEENARAGLTFIITVAQQTRGLPGSENLQVTQAKELHAELVLIKRAPNGQEPFDPVKKQPSLLQSALKSLFSLKGGIVLAIGATLVYAYRTHKRSSRTTTSD